MRRDRAGEEGRGVAGKWGRGEKVGERSWSRKGRKKQKKCKLAHFSIKRGATIWVLTKIKITINNMDV